MIWYAPLSSIRVDSTSRPSAGEPRAGLVRKEKLKVGRGKTVDFFILWGGDIVSRFIREGSEWEPVLRDRMLGAMEAAARRLKLPPSDVHFLDIGANIGVHTTAVQVRVTLPGLV
jgi:hypothetical protein